MAISAESRERTVFKPWQLEAQLTNTLIAFFATDRFRGKGGPIIEIGFFEVDS